MKVREELIESMQLKSHSIINLKVEMSAKKSSKETDQQSEFCQQFACDLQTCLDSKTKNLPSETSRWYSFPRKSI